MACRPPACERAMYTHPRYARRGVGRLVLSLCEAAAAGEGFRRLELMATLAGEPLYAAYGFAAVEHVTERSAGTSIPLVRMMKSIGAPTADDLADAPRTQNSVGSDGRSGTRGSGSGSRSGAVARTSS